jgi:RNA polymerase sigma-70 factor (ECF subfamily)
VSSPKDVTPGTVPGIEALYRAHVRQVAQWAARLAGPGVDVEDLVQEVFLRAGRMLPGFRGDSRVTTWLYGITENVVRGYRSKQKWRRWLGGAAADVAGELASRAPGPHEDLERRQACDLVYRVLDQLPDKARTLIILFELEGMTGEEIAALTGARVATVWVQLHRAREQFRLRLAKVQAARQQQRAAASRRGHGMA